MSEPRAGWFEEYGCGCTSPRERLKRDLPGYCPRHGENRRNVYRETDTTALHVQRIAPGASVQEEPRPHE